MPRAIEEIEPMQSGVAGRTAGPGEASSRLDRVDDAPGHLVQLYESDAFLVEVVDRFLGAGLGAGDAVIFIATTAHRQAVEERLRSRGLDLARARDEGRYLALDAAETLAEIVDDGFPDAERFRARVGRLLASAAAAAGDFGRVRAFGEMVALLCAEGKHAAAIRLEELWDELAETTPFTLLCAYPVSAFDGANDETSFETLCRGHARVLPAESYAHTETADDRARAIVRLQQKAHALEAEALARARAEASAEGALQEVMTVYQVGQMLVAELDLERLLQALTDAATRLTRAQFGAFFYNALDDQGGHYLLYTLSGAPREAFEKFGMPRNTALFGPTFAGEGVVRIDDVKQDPRYGKSPPHHGMPVGHLPVTSYLAAPVMGRSGEVFGGLFLGHAERGVFTEAAERIVVGLAAQAAIALDNARLYAAARRAQDEAEAANRAKDEFLSVVSHELRTPLASMLGWARVLKGFSLGERGDRAVETIERSGRAQAKLIEDLLDVSRIVGGQMRLDLRRVDLASVVGAVLEIIRPTADAKGVRLELEVDETAGAVAGDADRLQQVLWNLLSNAVKFTPAGGRVEVRLERREEELVLSVCDTGRGIAAEFLPYVYARFRQAENVASRSTGGVGLGLAIVRHLVELHGGQVGVASDGAGRGATFTVTFPATALSGDAELASPTADLLRGVRVLVLDDDAEARDTLRAILAAHGARVTTAEAAREARAILQRSSLDLVVSDVRVQDEEGGALAGAIRSGNGTGGSSIAAIALTGGSGEDEAKRALATGYQVHLAKPVDPELLVSAVRQLVSADRAKKVATCPTPPAAS